MAACCCSRCCSSIFVALVFGLVPALQVSRAALRDTIERFLRHDRPLACHARRARRRGSGAGADAARRRRLDDAQLRAADAACRRGSNRATCSPCRSICRQAKYKNALERTRFYKDAIHRVAAAAGRRVHGGRQRAADVSGRDRFRAALHHRGQGGAHQRRGTTRRHPDGDAEVFRNDEDAR